MLRKRTFFRGAKDDKREVELVWNGKTSDVCNLVLPFQVIKQVDEPRIEFVV